MRNIDKANNAKRTKYALLLTNNANTAFGAKYMRKIYDKHFFFFTTNDLSIFTAFLKGLLFLKKFVVQNFSLVRKEFVMQNFSLVRKGS